MSPFLFSVPEKTKLCGFSPGLIQGCITFSVSPLESWNNFVISLLNRHESGLLYTTSGRNLVLLTQSQGKVYVRYIMHQGLKSGAAVPSITVIKRLGLFYLSSCFWLSGLCFEVSIQIQKYWNLLGMRLAWDWRGLALWWLESSYWRALNSPIHWKDAVRTSASKTVENK